ncbi:MerR family transcriptional regulator [Streptomyces sp. NPDC005483]|uniref:MerR family transcriptional regulator n=1 Tax=Streptomyces sp. NPDC005483 TaxID=3154882 RepID=UPI0033B15366
MAESQTRLSIGEVAARSGVSVHTLRFYERAGVLLAGQVERSAGGRRVYTEDDVAWIDLCLILRASGMSLPVIRRYTELARAGAGTEPERLALLREHEEKVLGQLAEMHRCLDLIRHKVAVYEDVIESGAIAPGCNSPTGADDAV